MDKNIVAIGGGGFGRSAENLKIEKYILNLSKSEKPNVCFIPTATGDNDTYKLNFYKSFSKLQCNPSHIDFFKRTIELEEQIHSQDVIYVGGGNTKSMLAVWKEWGFDLILKKAYNSGKVMSGVSAGAICWFEKGITDSYKNNLSILNCLNFVKGISCPHYDEEASRRPYVENLIKEGTINSCIGIQGSAALHLKNGKPFCSLNFGDNRSTYLVTMRNSRLLNIPYESINL